MYIYIYTNPVKIMVNLVGKQDSFKAPVSLIQSSDLVENNLIIYMYVYNFKSGQKQAPV